MNEEARKQVVETLDELRDRVAERLGGDPSSHGPVAAEIEEVRTLVQDGPAEKKKAHAAAGRLERRLLAWEAEHPQLTALASRIASALEDAGM